MGWPVVVATNHKYRLHWGEGIDFTRMNAYIPTERWLENDHTIWMMTNFTDVRASINVTLRYGKGELIANETYLKPEADLQMGDNIVYN